ncbi:MAG TPA: polysaccharide biosynthesis/export family protein [Bacillota bacterium]|nr:polysaccharide biosynthesis/export family protein [Bacillota bacterium]
MKKIVILGFSVLLMVAFVVVGLAVEPDYRLGPGDVLEISVWGYEELRNPQLVIRPDGKIGFPLIEEVEAAGLTPAELNNKLTTALAKYIIDPKVTVNVIKFRKTRVYVLGEVYRPGLCEIENEHNLLDAIGVAGGFTKAADKKKVYLVRKGQTEQYTIVNLEKLIKKGDLSQNFQLSEGDVVFLARRKADYINDILPFISALYQIRNFDND